MKLSLVAFLLLLLFIPGRSQEIGKQLAELDTLFSRGEYEKAGQLAEKIYHTAAAKIKNDTVFVEFLNTYGTILYHQQEYAKAATRFSEAAEKAKVTLGEKEYHFALALFNLAGCYKELGKYVEAEPLYLVSLPVLATAFGQNSLEYTRCFYTLASLYLESARFQEAESKCAAAVNYYKVNPGPTSDDYLGALGTMGVIYQGQSRYDKAEEIFLSLKNYYSSLPSPLKATLQILENNLGELYRHMGDYQSAEPFLVKAIEMAGPSSLSSAYSLNNLALVQKALGKYAEAEASYKDAISIYKSLGKTEHPDYTNPVNNLGELYRTMGRLQDAVYAFEEVIDLRKRTLGTNHPNYANAVNNLALVEFVLGMYPEAEKHIAIGIALNVTDKKEPVVTWKDIRDKLQPGEFAVEMIRTDYYNNARWTDTIYYSALIIQRNSASPAIVIISGNDLENKNISTYRKALKAKLNDDLSYNSFWAPLKKALSGASRIYFSPDGVYQQLNLYTLKDPGSGKYLVDESDVRLVTNTRDILVSGIANTSKNAIIFSYPDFGKTKTSTSTGTNRVPGFPELEDLPGTKMESDSIRKILVQFDWTITEHTRKNATEEAVKKISKPAVLHIATHGYFLKDIRENEGKVMGIQSGIARQNPLLRSGVIMAGASTLASDPTAPANADDGILTAYEAAGLDLSSTELVILSACETGLGEILNGQGVYGLQRAFMVAGARSVIMSLWKIDDLATQQLMVHFYKAWQQDKEGGKQKALRTAQQKLREQFPHPYYWGAFVIVGNL